MNSKPKLVIITGRAGSGKSTLAKKLGELLYFPAILRDEIKEGYVNTFNIKHDELHRDTNKVVTEIFFKNLEFLLSKKVSVVAEAAFQHPVWKYYLPSLKKISNVFMIICEVDSYVAAQRHLQRGLKNPKREFFHGDNRVIHFRKTGTVLLPAAYETPLLGVPTIRVSTLRGYKPKLERIVKKIQAPS